jgi:hypothetical protein
MGHLGEAEGDGAFTSFEAIGEGMRANGPSTHGFVMVLDYEGTQKGFIRKRPLELNFNQSLGIDF